MESTSMAMEIDVSGTYFLQGKAVIQSVSLIDCLNDV